MNAAIKAIWITAICIIGMLAIAALSSLIWWAVYKFSGMYGVFVLMLVIVAYIWFVIYQTDSEPETVVRDTNEDYIMD